MRWNDMDVFAAAKELNMFEVQHHVSSFGLNHIANHIWKHVLFWLPLSVTYTHGVIEWRLSGTGLIQGLHASLVSRDSQRQRS